MKLYPKTILLKAYLIHLKELLFLLETMGNKASQLTLKSPICFNVYVEDLKNKPQLVNSLALKVALHCVCLSYKHADIFYSISQCTQEN